MFLAIPDVENNEGILTGKLFEYLGAKKPIVGVGPMNGDAAKIIRECQAGEMFDYHDQDKIFDYLLNKYKLWQKGGKINLDEDIVANYSRKTLARELASLMNK